MKNSERVIYGLLLTIIVFLLVSFVGEKIKLSFQLVSFVTDSAMLILAIVLICYFRKYVNFKIALPKFKTIWKPILLGIFVPVIVSFLFEIIGNLLGFKSESHPALVLMSPLQVFLLVFILASVAEEVLFRGFLQNILKPLQVKGIKIFKRHISVPVIISALAFSLAHLGLMKTDVGAFFIVSTLIFTFTLGLIAGYYQEKYDNNAYAILVHMGGNFIGLMGSLYESLILQ